MRCKVHTSILKGLISFSPGLARFVEGLPWVIADKFHNSERVVYQTIITLIQHQSYDAGTKRRLIIWLCPTGRVTELP
jgi:hypothetical protein